jgi:transposase
MARTTKRAPLVLTDMERNQLTRIHQSRTGSVREVQRAEFLLRYANGETISDIQRALSTTRPTIYKCIDKALAMGIDAALKDQYHRAKEPVITEQAKAWVIHLACTKPKELGFAAEVWTINSLATYVRKHAATMGHDSLTKAVKATVWRILNAHQLRPHKIRYYLERRDEAFEEKMREVLLVYQQVNLQNQQEEQAQPDDVITVSVDEKPGVQGLKSIAPDLPPVPGQHQQWGRDYEYKRLGTLSILAALDLHDGQVIAQVHSRHRSREFILLLKELDARYPEHATIRIILDNHSSHISKETRAYLATRPNRFVYVHTPKHGSWLNMIEMAFSRMARSFLRHIRVDSLDELKQRILKGIEEMNAQPVLFRWKKFDTISD